MSAISKRMRKVLSPGKFLVLLNLAWFSIVALLLFALQDLHQNLLYKNDTVKALAQEIRWQRYSADKAKAQVATLPEMEFLVGVMETRDKDLYSITKAAWKWGRVYQVSPYLILAVVHRESNFNPAARSYDKDGVELAMGAMQINYRVWKDTLKLDISRMSDVDYNVQNGVIILKHYLDRNPGDVSRALWEYWGRGESYSYSPRVLESKYFN
jgi:soluble lytic murein transglycosylase-like protein